MISIGSVGTASDQVEALFLGDVDGAGSLDQLLTAMHRDDFDLVAIGRSMLADRRGRTRCDAGDFRQLKAYIADVLKDLV